LSLRRYVLPTAILFLLALALPANGQYTSTIFLSRLEATPHSTPRGGGATLHGFMCVKYLDGNNVTLSPPQATIYLTNGTNSAWFKNYTLTPTGVPCEYTFNITVSSRIPLGETKLYVHAMSLTDGTNYGPASETSADETPNPGDISRVLVTPEFPSAWQFLTTLLVVLAAVGILKRRRS